MHPSSEKNGYHWCTNWHRLGMILNWDYILIVNLSYAISETKYLAIGIPPTFYMSFYILGVVCPTILFPRMGWQWIPNEKLIHAYFQILWEHKCRIHYTRIWEHFMAPLYTTIHNKLMQCMTVRVMQVVKATRDWYVTKKGTCLRIFGTTQPHNYCPSLYLINRCYKKRHIRLS